MTVAELLRRVSAKELVDWQAYDQLTYGGESARTPPARGPAPRGPQATIPAARQLENLDRWWPPES